MRDGCAGSIGSRKLHSSRNLDHRLRIAPIHPPPGPRDRTRCGAAMCSRKYRTFDVDGGLICSQHRASSGRNRHRRVRPLRMSRFRRVSTLGGAAGRTRDHDWFLFGGQHGPAPLGCPRWPLRQRKIDLIRSFARLRRRAAQTPDRCPQSNDEHGDQARSLHLSRRRLVDPRLPRLDRIRFRDFWRP